ncbi:MAG: type ISP restriction/modification enzyme [Patescibacteria group bacterium]|jgi:predicted helicase
MVNTYLNKLQTELITGNAMEHSYRPAFKSLIEQIDETIQAVNEPTRSAHGSPDFIFLKKGNKNFTFGYAETKDINVNLNDIEKTEQLKRYLGYPRLILTNYIEFRFFRNGEKYQTIEIAKRENTFLKPLSENFLILEKELKAFLEGKPEKITSGIRLAQIMGGKALRIRENVTKYLSTNDGKSEELKRIFKIMKEFLVHDLKIEKFADMYAQTLVYGLFVARYYDETPENFTRQEARDLVPASNPFLQQFFDHIVGPKFDIRLAYIVDEICEIFSIADIREIIRRHFNLFGEVTDKDPIIHFYEDFLKEYDPQLRKEMGAYYTPIPVVNFIIRAVDEVLIKEFKLNGGLANTDKIIKEVITQGKKGKETFHKVQILDPAVGTATFLNEIIKLIYSKYKDQKGLWNNYVNEELLPRLYGFELMMAPYTIAHLKLAMTLKEMGINKFSKRLGVYLTNTLEEGMKTNNELFNFGLAEAISDESKAANEIKNNRPIMVVVANPPYSGVSSNETDFANSLVNQYKVEPGGREKLQERKHWLNDDYVKFIAFAEKLINKNGEGIMAMITNHGYLDNPTFRGMRWHLNKSFNKIYLIDLHGNAKKNLRTPDGNIDKNVFDIQQGVSIIVAIKIRNKANKSSEVYRADIWGKRQEKFDVLNKSSMENIKWQKINLDQKSFGFTFDKNPKLQEKYKQGISIAELFPVNTTGIVTMGDSFIIADSKEELKYRLDVFLNQDITETELQREYKLGKNYAGWIISNKNKMEIKDELFKKIAYRPFDDKWTYFDNKLIWRPRTKILKEFLYEENFGFMICRQQKRLGFSHILVHKNISESSYVSNRTSEIGYSFPLYIYSASEQINIDQTQTRKSNLDMNLVRELLFNIGKYEWVDDHKNKKEENEKQVSPLDVLDYVYAVLHSPKYRNTYKDFLREDFPRVPAVLNKESFWELVKLGEKLRNLHLLEDTEISKFSTKYSISGNNEIENIRFENDKVWINNTQYFEGISKAVWDFYIGGYQPAQKWLKDRKDKELNFEDLTHYQKIIESLERTIEVMNKIDEILNT